MTRNDRVDYVQQVNRSIRFVVYWVIVEWMEAGGMKEPIRHFGFWIFDHLRNGKVLRHVQELQHWINHPGEIESVHIESLSNLLHHATRHTPYYRTYQGVKDLTEFPVLTKSILREQGARMLSDEHQKRISVFTSGSYGTPMVFHLSPEKKARRLAEAMVYNQLAGYRVGCRYALVNGEMERKKRAFMRFINNEVRINQTHFSDSELEWACNRLAKGDIPFVIGWPSVITPIAQYAEYKGMVFSSIRGVISMGEMLLEANRAQIQRVFPCPLLNRYAAVELGVVAHEMPHEKGMIINRASYRVEILKRDRDEPAFAGDVGRIVITDLFSHGMPLIRYDIGDLAVSTRNSTTGAVVLDRIEGRTLETVFHTDGTVIAPLSLFSAIPKSEKKKMRQFQIVQTSPTDVEVNVDSSDQSLNSKAIVQSIQALMGSDTRVRINRVKAIFSLPSGKRPVIMQKMHSGSNQSQK